MNKRCPRCGMDEEGKGLMCASSDAPEIRWSLVLRTAGFIVFVLLALTLAHGGAF